MSEGNTLRPPRLLALVIAVEGTLAVFALVGFRLAGIHPLAGARFEPSALLLAGAATAVGLAFVAWTLRSRWSPLTRLRRLVVHRVAPIFASSRVAELVVIAALAGVSEELFFRCFLQTAIGRASSPLVALLIASLLFGAAHLLSITYAVAATLFGLMWGGVFLLTGNPLAPIVAHAVYDLFALLTLRSLTTAP